MESPPVPNPNLWHWRFSAMLVALASGKADVSTYWAQQELLGYYKMLVAVLPKLREIDTWLLLYRLDAGPASDTLEEVKALLWSRAQYLNLISNTPFWGTDPVDTLLKKADAYYADWRGRAADERKKHVADAIEELTRQVGWISLYPIGMGGPGAQVPPRVQHRTCPSST